MRQESSPSVFPCERWWLGYTYTDSDGGDDDDSDGDGDDDDDSSRRRSLRGVQARRQRMHGAARLLPCGSTAGP